MKVTQYHLLPEWKYSNHNLPGSTEYSIQEAYEKLFIYENVIARSKHSKFMDARIWIEDQIENCECELEKMFIYNALHTNQIWKCIKDDCIYKCYKHNRPSLFLLRKDWMTLFHMNKVAYPRYSPFFTHHPKDHFDFDIDEYDHYAEEFIPALHALTGKLSDAPTC